MLGLAWISFTCTMLGTCSRDVRDIRDLRAVFYSLSADKPLAYILAAIFIKDIYFYVKYP